MGARVLVVDDDPQVLKLLQVNFEMEGYVVVCASDGQQALEAADEADLMVCDVMMPGIDGLDVTRRVKARHHDLPIILLSAKAQRADEAAGLEAGADVYMTKPFDPSELLSTAERLLSS